MQDVNRFDAITGNHVFGDLDGLFVDARRADPNDLQNRQACRNVEHRGLVLGGHPRPVDLHPTDRPVAALLDSIQPLTCRWVLVYVGNEVCNAWMNPRDVDLKRRLRSWSGHPEPAEDLCTRFDTQKLGDAWIDERRWSADSLAVAHPDLLAACGGK